MDTGKTALVTGGTRGIGLSITRKLAKLGYCVGVVGTSLEPDGYPGLMSFLEEYEDCIYLSGDISKQSDRVEIVDGMMETFGHIDVLVNNAGVAPKIRTDLLELTEASMDYVLAVNLKGTFFLTQMVANKMIQNLDEHMAPGRIVNIGSVSAYTSSISRGEYCISKAGVGMVTSLFADRLAEYGINVYEIRPGIISTDMTASVTAKYDKLIFEDGITPIKRWGLPEDIAKAVEALCLDLFPFSTGQVINVDGGFHIRRL